MSQAAAEPTAAARKPGEAQSYWDLAIRDFRRNRLAMGALCVVFFVVFVAIYCPLLANNRPLYIKAVFRNDFENAAFVALEELEKLKESAQTSSTERAAAFAAINPRIDTMVEMLPDSARAALESKRQAMSAAATAPTLDVAAFTKALDEFTTLYVDETPELIAVVRYPAFRSLTAMEIWFFTAFHLALLVLILRNRVRSLVVGLLLVAIPATAVAYGARTVWPAMNDPKPYRKLIEAKGFDGSYVRPIIPFGENENILENSRVQPRWAMPILDQGKPKERPNPHWLGTDTNGRDVLTRMVYGARVSMVIGILAVSIYTVIGIVIGACAGFFRGWVDLIVSRVIEVVICFPFLMMILAVQAFLAPSIFNIIATLGLLSWTGVARLQRGEFLRLVNLDFVQAVRALGGSNVRIIFLHILPNALGPILVLISFGIAGSIVVESSLSFLGFGVPQPMASWGDLLNNSRNDPQGLWWLTVFPGLAIFLTVTCFNLMGEGVRDALDPRRDR